MDIGIQKILSNVLFVSYTFLGYLLSLCRLLFYVGTSFLSQIHGGGIEILLLKSLSTYIIHLGWNRNILGRQMNISVYVL